MQVTSGHLNWIRRGTPWTKNHSKMLALLFYSIFCKDRFGSKMRMSVHICHASDKNSLNLQYFPCKPWRQKISSKAQLPYQLQSSFVHLTSFRIIQSCINFVGNTEKHKTSYKNSERIVLWHMGYPCYFTGKGTQNAHLEQAQEVQFH